jgi:hypothetical protein
MNLAGNFVNFKIMTVINLYLYNTLLFVKKNLNALSRDVITHNYETRARNNYIRPLKHKTKIYEKSISYKGIKLYNDLPVNVKDLAFNEFKMYIKNFFVNNVFYSISEYETCIVRM